MRSRFSKFPHSFALSLFIISLTVSGFAEDATLADIFCDGMVLQRDRPIPVWGTADDGTTVLVTIGQDQADTKASEGKWMVQLPPRPASAEPVPFTVSFNDTKQSLNNVVVGEVWLCSGQSNMAGTIHKRAPRPLEDMPLVRQFGKPRGNQKDAAVWITAEGDSIPLFSSVSIYFGESLYKKLDVPVGLILAAVSGTPIEEWVPRASLESDPEIKASIEKVFDRETRLRLSELQKKKKAGEGLSPEEKELLQLRSLTSPGRLHSIHVEPTVPYSIRGVIWYQGEANSKTPENAAEYGKYLRLLISGLRQVYQQPALPFYAVQLPSISAGKKDRGPLVYEIVRQQQLETVQETTHTGLAVTIDINEGLHPNSKHIVGDRLGALALHEVYGVKEPATYTSPLLQSVRFQGSDAVCTFDHAEGGLVLKENPLKLFEIAGDDGAFYPAQAAVQGSELVLTSEQVSNPQAVRYAYHSQLDQVSLFGSTDLPVSPFVFP